MSSAKLVRKLALAAAAAAAVALSSASVSAGPIPIPEDNFPRFPGRGVRDRVATDLAPRRLPGGEGALGALRWVLPAALGFPFRLWDADDRVWLPVRRPAND